MTRSEKAFRSGREEKVAELVADGFSFSFDKFPGRYGWWIFDNQTGRAIPLGNGTDETLDRAVAYIREQRTAGGAR